MFYFLMAHGTKYVKPLNKHTIYLIWSDNMSVKSVSIRIEEEMLDKIAYIADYEGRSINSQVLILIRENIKNFEEANGKINGSISAAANVKPARK